MLSKFTAPSENVKYGILFFITLIACIFIYIFVITPLSKDRTALANKLTIENTKLAALQTFAGQNQNYEALLKIQKAKVEQARKKLPDTVAVPDLISEYNKLAENNNIFLKSLKPDQAVKVGQVFEMPVEMTLQGDYFKIITFLQQVENGERFVTLQGTEFDADKSGQDLNMKAKFTVYALKNVLGAPIKGGNKQNANKNKIAPTDARMGQAASNVKK